MIPARYRWPHLQTYCSSGSGNKHLDRGWARSFSAVSLDERQLEGVGILTS